MSHFCSNLHLSNDLLNVLVTYIHIVLVLVQTDTQFCYCCCRYFILKVSQLLGCQYSEIYICIFLSITFNASQYTVSHLAKNI